MTKSFRDMLHLFSCGAFGISPNPSLQYDFGEIFKLSNQQQISTVVYLAVAELHKNGVDVDDEIYKKWEQQFLSRYVFSINRGKYLVELVKKLDSLGIENCVLKGDVLSALYKTPNSRVSSDIDLWIVDNNRIPEAMDILRQDGFTVHEGDGKSHQIECRHKTYGLIELHRDFYDEVEKIWFKNEVQLSNNFLMDIQHHNGGTIHTLNYTDGAIHITLHFIKHFLSHGCGCRQLFDTLLYLSCYTKEIDWQKYDTIISELGYAKLIDICKKCGAAYFNMDFEVPSEQEEELCDALLTDMEGAGVFGKNEEYRNGFFFAYLKKRSSGFKNSILFIKKLCFNSVKYLVSHKFNICKIIKDLRVRKLDKINLQNIDKRLNLFKKLDLY